MKTNSHQRVRESFMNRYEHKNNYSTPKNSSLGIRWKPSYADSSLEMD